MPPMQPIRRNFLWRFGDGLGGIALASPLRDHNLLAAGVPTPAPHLPRPHHPPPATRVAPRAKRVVQLYMSGAASQCDTFDYKPLLEKQHGRKWDPGEKVELFQSAPGQTMQSPFPWRRYGQCGKYVNDCVAPLGSVVD